MNRKETRELAGYNLIRNLNLVALAAEHDDFIDAMYTKIIAKIY